MVGANPLYQMIACLRGGVLEGRWPGPGELLAPALFNLTVYYTTLDVTSLLCMGMLLVASLFCVPGRGRLMRELDLQKDEPEK